MKLNHVIHIIVILITAALAMPSHADRISGGGKFVGLSNNLALGDVGLVGLETACVKTFNRRTRVCTSEEIIKAVPFRKPIPEEGAWVYPTTVDATPDLTAGGVDMFDFSLTGATSLTNFSCRGWTTTIAGGGGPAQGLIVYGHKRFRTDNCDVPRAVSCCRAE